MQTMDTILVGFDGSDRAQRALNWACTVAHREKAKVTLLAVIDPGSDRLVADEGALETAVESVLEQAKQKVQEQYPDMQVETQSCKGDIVESLLREAEHYDLLVVGSHHNVTVGEKVFGAKGLRIASGSCKPTAVVPSDWFLGEDAHGIVVAVGPDDTTGDAVVMGVHLALSLDEPLELISAWGIPSILSVSAEKMGGGLEPVGAQFQRKLDSFVAQIKEKYPDLEVTGRAVEGSAPTPVVMQCAKNKRALLLGSHTRSRVSRALFGSVMFGVMARLEIPTIVVPTK